MAELRQDHGHSEPSASLDYHNPRCPIEEYSSLGGSTLIVGSEQYLKAVFSRRI